MENFSEMSQKRNLMGSKIYKLVTLLYGKKYNVKISQIRFSSER